MLKLVLHRQWVFSLPKRLWIYSRFNRKLLTKLSWCAWKLLIALLKQSVTSFDESVPGAAIAVHTFGDFQQYNPHLHIIATEGCFSGRDTFNKKRAAAAKELEDIFRYEVLKKLKAEGKIIDAVIENMLFWHHSGFNVYCSPTIWPNNDRGVTSGTSMLLCIAWRS